MLFTPLALAFLANGVFAQTENQTFVATLGPALQQLGLTTFLNAVSNTTSQPDVKAALAFIGNTPATILAPTNAAFAAASANITGNLTTLGATLAYHLLHGSLNASDIASSPTHTVARSFLSDPNYVKLPSDQSQAVVLTNNGGQIQAFNLGKQATVTNTSSFGNLLIHFLDTVLEIPPDFGTTCTALNLTIIQQVLGQLGGVNPFASPGITVFAPQDAAINAIITQLTSAPSAQLETIVGNHIVNGTAVFSNQLQSGLISAAGEPFTFTTNSTGTFVTSGSSTAQIVQSDVVFANGVIHVINGVLFDTNADPAAAASALSANSVQATATGTTSASASATTKSKSAAAARFDFAFGALAFQATVVVLGGVFGTMLLL